MGAWPGLWAFCEALWCRASSSSPFCMWCPLLRPLGCSGDSRGSMLLTVAQLSGDSIETLQGSRVSTAFSADSPMCSILADSPSNMDEPMGILPPVSLGCGAGKRPYLFS